MRAVQLKEYGDVENLKLVDIDVPEPGPGQVRVKVAFAGLRWTDITQRRGGLAHKPRPFTAGQELSGTIDALGEGVTGHAVGDRVFAAGPALAEYAVVDVSSLIPLPHSAPLERTLAYPVNLRAAYLMVYVWGNVSPGQTVVLHAGAGGVGTVATHILKRKLDDVRVIALCSTDEKCAFARKNGADHAINYKASDYVDEVLKITGPKAGTWDYDAPLGAADVVYNSVSGDTLTRDPKIVRRRGTWVIYGASGGAAAPLDTAPYAFDSFTIKRVSMLAWTNTDEGRAADDFMRDWLANEELLEPTIYPLDEVVAAERALENGETMGKVVIRI